MKTYRIELRGVITRNIIWRDVEADSVAEARQIAEVEYPTYRIVSTKELTKADMR